MSSGNRRPTPLFDLMSDRHGALRTQGVSKPTVRVELEPAPGPSVREIGVPGSMPPSETLEHHAPASSTTDWAAGPDLRLSRVALGIAITLVGALVFGAYSLGYSLGRREGDKESADLARRLDDVREPLAEPAPIPEQNKNNQSAQPQPGPDPKPPAPQGESLTSKGLLAGDPREKGMNYLVLGTFSKEEAQSAVDFLASNSVQAFAVAVESKRQAGNNPSPARTYTLYALPGITTEEYRRGVTKKTNLEAEVARIGAIWQKQHRGPSNFSKTMWDKFD